MAAPTARAVAEKLVTMLLMAVSVAALSRRNRSPAPSSWSSHHSGRARPGRAGPRQRQDRDPADPATRRHAGLEDRHPDQQDHSGAAHARRPRVDLRPANGWLSRRRPHPDARTEPIEIAADAGLWDGALVRAW